MNATFKAKIQTDESGTFVKIPKRLTIDQSTNRHGQIGQLVIDRRLGLCKDRIVNLPDPTGQIVCTQGGFISEFLISV
jgi:hypothetical protein